MIEAREIFDEEGYKEEQRMKNEIKRKRKSDYYHRHVKELCPEKRRIFFGNANPQKFITHRLKMKAMPEEERKMRIKERTERTREIRKKRYEEKKQNMSEEQKAIQRKKLAEYQRRRRMNELILPSKDCNYNGLDNTLIHNTNDFNRDAALVLVSIVEKVGSEFDKATSIVNYTGSDCDAVLVPIVEKVGSEFDKATSIVNYTGSDCDAVLVPIVEKVGSEFDKATSIVNYTGSDCDAVLVPIVEGIGSNICVASNCDFKVNIVDDSDINRFDLSNNNNNYHGDDSSIAGNEDRNISNNVTLYIHNALQSIMTNDDTMSAAQQLLRLHNSA